MRSTEWSADALADFKAAIDYIARESETAAHLVATRIRDAVNDLGDMPTGRRGRVDGTYEKVVRRTPYIVAYRRSDEKISVARVIHAARDWPEDDWLAE